MSFQPPLTLATQETRYGKEMVHFNTKDPAKKTKQRVELGAQIARDFLPGLPSTVMGSIQNEFRPQEQQRDWWVQGITGPGASVWTPWVPPRAKKRVKIDYDSWE
jgi:hypothetical protein